MIKTPKFTKYHFRIVKYIIIALLIIWAFVGTITMTDHPSLYLKFRIKQLDNIHFDGFLQTMVFGSSLFKLPISPPARDNSLYAWVPDTGFLAIGHRLGPKLSTGENTIETFNKGIEMGFRIFEVDIALTTDNYLICYHGVSDRELKAIKYSDYLALMKRMHLQPCIFEDLVELAKRHPDVKFILDVKNRFDDSYILMRNKVSLPSLAKSFIPQLYSFDQVEQFQGDSFFAGELFTGYRSRLTVKKIIEAAKANGIRVITLSIDRVPEIDKDAPKDISILIHPVNDPFIADSLKRKGIKGIYTSYITNLTVPELFKPNKDFQ